MKVILLTSLCWCILDVWILNYFSGCAIKGSKSNQLRDGTDLSVTELNDNGRQDQSEDESAVTKTKEKESFLEKMIPDG